MILLRSFFLAGLALFFAAQQALCACEAPQAQAPAVMEMAAHTMPAGHACDETQAPEHDKSACPHCASDADIIAQAAQAGPAPVLSFGPAPAFTIPAQPIPASTPPVRPPKFALYRAADPPRLTPLQLKTRFLN